MKEKYANLLIVENNDVFRVPMHRNKGYTLGRAAKGAALPDIPLQAPYVSRNHGRFMMVDGLWFYCDADGTNGTYYNGKRIRTGINGRTSPILLRSGDVLRIYPKSTSSQSLNNVWCLYLERSLSGEAGFIPFSDKGVLTIGRHPENDIVFPMPYVSAQHAKLYETDGRYCIADCNSKAGTYVNNTFVNREIRVKEGDKIAICDYRLIVSHTGMLVYQVENDLYGSTGYNQA